jgi:hypothetical protein
MVTETLAMAMMILIFLAQWIHPRAMANRMTAPYIQLTLRVMEYGFLHRRSMVAMTLKIVSLNTMMMTMTTLMGGTLGMVTMTVAVVTIYQGLKENII